MRERGREKRWIGERPLYLAELLGVELVEDRRRSGGSASSPSLAAPMATQARVWGKRAAARIGEGFPGGGAVLI